MKRLLAVFVALLALVSVVATPSTSTAGARKTPAFAFYYLWWSDNHWHDKLGPNYPYDADPLPLPATLPAEECPPTSNYEANQLTDVPAQLYSQDDPGVIETHVRQAAAAGLRGFAVNWKSGSTYDPRLAEMFRAVDEVRAEGTRFKLVLSYKSSASIVPVDEILADFTYIRDRYSASRSWWRAPARKPVVIFQGSRKYSVDVLSTVYSTFADDFTVIGDETRTTWTDERAAHLDGASWYWSTQNPYTNPASFDQIAELAARVRAAGKLWLAPFTPGYNSILLGGSTCIPRRGGETMRLLFEGNAASSPDAWTFISWNEIAEGSYIEPMQRYGTTYTDVLRDLLAAP